MLVGEIGINRREYLYELKYCDILLIVRGYFKRHHYGWEQARFVAYHVRYCMGVKKDEVVPTIEKWHPFPWEQEQEHSGNDLPTPEEEAELQEDMKNFSW